jgi:hypothetical protein
MFDTPLPLDEMPPSLIARFWVLEFLTSAVLGAYFSALRDVTTAEDFSGRLDGLKQSALSQITPLPIEVQQDAGVFLDEFVRRAKRIRSIEGFAAETMQRVQ